VIGRRQFLKTLGVVAVGGVSGVLPEPAAAQVDDARVERVTFEVVGLDPAHDGLRVAQLSDLHVGPSTPDGLVRAAIDEANRFRPDLVVLTGDYLSRPDEEGVELEAMRVLLGGLSAPTVAVLGNHDVWVDPGEASKALHEHGYAVLENAWTTVRLRGAPLRVVGIGDHLTRRDDVLRATKGLRAGAALPLVLAHGPRTAEKLDALGWKALCLSGHTHGGQVNLPILTPLLFASLRQPYARGRYTVGGVTLYVNRGIGNSGVRLRLNSPPEVTLATLRHAEPGAPAGRSGVPA
jgi:predicted MPP superfamily phosphohydrolase